MTEWEHVKLFPSTQSYTCKTHVCSVCSVCNYSVCIVNEFVCKLTTSMEHARVFHIVKLYVVMLEVLICVQAYMDLRDMLV